MEHQARREPNSEADDSHAGISPAIPRLNTVSANALVTRVEVTIDRHQTGYALYALL